MRRLARSRPRKPRFAAAVLAVVWAVGGGFQVAHADMSGHEPHFSNPVAWMLEADGHRAMHHARATSDPSMPFLCDEDDPITVAGPGLPGAFGAGPGLAILAQQAPEPSPSVLPGMDQFDLEELGPFPDVPEEDLRTVSDAILCQCGCGLTVSACELSMPCSVSPKMKYDAAVMLSEGKTPQETLDQFAADYGEKVLASPTKKGINIVSWVLPFAALAAGVGLVVWMLAGWRKQAPAEAETAAPAPDVDPDVQARIDDEVNRGL